MEMPTPVIASLVPVMEKRIFEELSFKAKLSGMEVQGGFSAAKRVKINKGNRKKAVTALNEYVTEIIKRGAK